ncbi:SEC-C metal-binding domain-containing protein [uncultured Cetobacterium sp.]|uniref:SEC-C metal-binding domain-containing protein n=1 Tax=uncultured Cetobacterium sp. TaxID=527638 RepID=UPI0026223709|nr:SEC-C metal-binding domain-containing protein [uncultured Cetobacterium sp.]
MEDKFLMESLNSLLKDDLFKILAKFDIKLAKSTVKGKIIEKIIEVYLNNSKTFLEVFSKDTIALLSQYNENNNKVSEKDFYEYEEFLIPLQSFGFISKNIIKEKDNNHYTISTWFLKNLHEISNIEDNKKVIDFNQELEMLILGMIRFYGVIDENKLLELLIPTFKNITLEKIHSFIDNRWILNVFVSKIQDSGSNLVYLVADSVSEPVDILHETIKYDNLDYKILTNDEYKNYWNYFFIEKTQEIADLIALLMGHKLQGAQIGFEITTIIDKLKNNVPVNEIINDFKTRIIFDNLDSEQIFTNIVTRIANTLPLWCLKGHSFIEIFGEAQEPRSVTKIGRNDICPCGSGKKYKKCCGK